jgi:hypothetical protein
MIKKELPNSGSGGSCLDLSHYTLCRWDKMTDKRLVNDWCPDDRWSINYVKCQIEKIDELLKEYPDSDTYKYVRSVWVERLAKYESRV